MSPSGLRAPERSAGRWQVRQQCADPGPIVSATPGVQRFVNSLLCGSSTRACSGPASSERSADALTDPLGGTAGLVGLSVSPAPSVQLVCWREPSVDRSTRLQWVVDSSLQWICRLSVFSRPAGRSPRGCRAPALRRFADPSLPQVCRLRSLRGSVGRVLSRFAGSEASAGSPARTSVGLPGRARGQAVGPGHAVRGYQGRRTMRLPERSQLGGGPHS